MPRKKLYSKTRRTNKLRRFRYGRRKLAYPRYISASKYNKHNYLRWETEERVLTLPANVTGTAFDAYVFRLNALQNVAELTALYDQFRINWVKLLISWSPKQTFNTDYVNNWVASGAFTPQLWYMKDYDDANVPVDITEFKQSNKARALRLMPNKDVKIVMKPACLNLVYEGAVDNAYVPKWRQYIDCADNSTPHYGLKLAVSYLPLQDLGALNIRIQYGVTMKQTR